MKILLAWMIVIALITPALGQTQSKVPPGQKCSLTVEQSPAIRGLRLGMNVDEVLRQFPGSSDDIRIRGALAGADQQFGAAGFSMPSYQYKSDPKFAGVKQFELEFLDKRLSALSVYYNGPEWSSIDQFVSRVSESLNLPGPIYWTSSDLAGLKTLKCAGFEIRLYTVANLLQARNLTAERIVTERREEAKERARKEFKP